MTTLDQQAGNVIRPFTVQIRERTLDDLRRRLETTRWPTTELVGQPSGNLAQDHILDNVTAYWLTGTSASAARSYWEAYGPDAPAAGSRPLPPPRIPVSFSTFPGEIWRTPRSWAEMSYPTLSCFGEAGRGGHFAAWEEPELFAAQLRAAFGSLR